MNWVKKPERDIIGIRLIGGLGQFGKKHLIMQTLVTLEVYIAAKAFRKEVMITANTFPKKKNFC